MSGPVAHDPLLSDEVFAQLLESQQPHCREAWRKLNIQTAEKFRSKQLALEAAMLKRLQQGGQTPAHTEFTALEPWRALWPNVFVHICETAQVTPAKHIDGDYFSCATPISFSEGGNSDGRRLADRAPKAESRGPPPEPFSPPPDPIGRKTMDNGRAMVGQWAGNGRAMVGQWSGHEWF